MNIIILGTTAFPHHYGAEIQRLKIISKSMVDVGISVTVINKYGTNNIKNVEMKDLKPEGYWEGVKYIYMSAKISRDNNIFVRNYYKIKGSFLELIYLVKLVDKDTIFVVSSLSSFSVFKYIIIARIRRFRILLHLVELNTGQYYKNNILVRTNDYIFEKYVFKSVNAIIPISNYLVDLIKSQNYNRNIFLLPLLSDIKRFSDNIHNSQNHYFLYCASEWFEKEFHFIIDCYYRIDNSSFKLYLVINGSDNFIKNINIKITELGMEHNIFIYSKISDEEINILYKNAYSLLVPLSNSIRDRARFPHKISEYICTGNPIITVNCGEIQYYFKNYETAFIVEEYSISKYSDMMKYVIENPDEARRVGKNALKLAETIFSPDINIVKLKKYIEDLN